MAANTGVYPVFDNVFKIGKSGRLSEASDMVSIAEMESFSISIDGNVEKSGTDCDTKFEWDFPNGDKLEFDAVVNVTNIGGGDSTNVAALEFDVMSHGKPTYTPAATV